MALFLAMVSVGHAATLTWDANGSTTPNPSDGSGTWLTANNWWNGSNNVSGTWSGSTPDSALFGAGTPGSYTVFLGTINSSNVTFATSGYTLAGGSLTLSASSGTNLVVSNNVTATINSSLTQGGGATWAIGNGATLGLGGGGFSPSGNFVWKGGGTVNLTGGIFTPAVLWLQNVTVNQSGGAVNPAPDVLLGYAGNCTYTLSGASSSMNIPNRLLVGRAGSTGILNLQGGSILASANNGGPAFSLGYDGSSVGVLNQSGGTLTVLPGQKFYINYQASSSGGSGTVNLSGGTINATTIQFGNATTAYNLNTYGTLNLSGGTLNLGTGGLVASTNSGGPPGHINIMLSGGTVVATASWSSALPMTLTNLNGDVTFQAADATGKAQNIALAGVLSGIGGLRKTGAGTLTLSAANTYTGATVVNGGTILLSGSGAIASNSSVALTNGGCLLVMNTAAANNANRLGNASPIILNGGSVSFLNDGSAANFSESAGTLTVNSGANVVTCFPATNGQTSVVTFAGLAHGGGTVDFQMSGAGTSQNKVFFTAPPALGTWLTVNGALAAYDTTYGLHTASSYVDISARGSTISNAPTVNVRISSAGTDGNIQLDSATTVINSLQQNVGTAAIVDTAGKVFRVNQITANAGAQSLTIGAAPGDGVLTVGSVGGNLTLANAGAFSPGLVLNATLSDNLVRSSLTVLGGAIVTLAAPNNTFSGGTTLSNGSLAITTGTTVSMFYTNLGGNLTTRLSGAGTTLPMSGLTLGGRNPQLSFDLGGAANLAAPLMNIAGDIGLNGDVWVNVTNPLPGTSVLLQYSGRRTGAGRFLLGNAPAGAGIVDDPVSQQVSLVYFAGPTVLVPPHNTNAIVVALATPQQYGAVGDGVTDDSAAFQSAVAAVNNAGGVGGGVVYVPSGTYAFSNNLTIPPGVTLQGDWTDWSLGSNGVAGTLFKVCVGAGQSNGTPFITMNRSALKGVSIWYPNQDPANITPYPFTISLASGDTVVEEVALINSYQGINADGAAKHIISSVFGSPLYTGIQVDDEYDISHQDDVRFSPDYWPASQLPGSPAPDGPHATWMRSNGVGERLLRADGEACMDVFLSGYQIGIYGLLGINGGPAASFYGCCVTNCATAYLDAAGGGNTGMEFTWCTLDGDIAFDRNTSNDGAAFFHTCQLAGRSGVAIRQIGGSSSTVQFQNCNVAGTVRVDGGIANFVNSSFTVPAASNHCVMASGAIYAAFTGCNFTPARKISNSANSRRLVLDDRRASTSPLPLVDWADIRKDWRSRRPAKLDLFIATSSPWNAVGDGVADDTAAIQSALNAAGRNGGGIVYLPAGEYKLTSTLDVPSGVELRGSYPSRHAASLYDGHVKVTVLQPYAGVGTTNGPPAVALEANAGILGLSITYELQDTNATAYPPAIQGRGPNVYAYGILCPNAYWYVDLNSYSCTNHLFYQVDGWAIGNAFVIGNGSAGSLVECMANLSYWVDNNLSASVLVSAWQPPIKDFTEHHLDWFVLGDCTELMVKNFDYLCHTFMRCIDQNGRGPWVTGIITECDAAVECFRFEAAADCHIDIVNPEWMVTLADYADLTGYGVISTPSFQGTARFFNAPLWGSRKWDYVLQGGDVGFELTHMGYLSTYGSKVDGGVAHFINCGFEGNTSSYYTVPFNSTSAGVPGKVSEIIGCYAWTGLKFTRSNTNNPVLAWGNFGVNTLTTQTPFTMTPPQLLVSQTAAPGSLNVVLDWRADMGFFNPYYATDLAPPVTWVPLNTAPLYSSNGWTVVDPAGASRQRYYRLQP